MQRAPFQSPPGPADRRADQNRRNQAAWRLRARMRATMADDRNSAVPAPRAEAPAPAPPVHSEQTRKIDQLTAMIDQLTAKIDRLTATLEGTREDVANLHGAVLDIPRRVTFNSQDRVFPPPPPRDTSSSSSSSVWSAHQRRVRHAGATPMNLPTCDSPLTDLSAPGSRAPSPFRALTPAGDMSAEGIAIFRSIMNSPPPVARRRSGSVTTHMNSPVADPDY